METATPNLKEASIFARSVKQIYPHQIFAYNLSPSFNWDATNMSDKELAEFNDELGRLGFTWQFITLAGFHANGLQVSTFAKNYGREGMLAYVRDIQRQERKHSVPLLTHQKWSGAELVDRMVNTATGGSSTSAMGEGVTEKQFHEVHSNDLSKI